MSSSSASFPNIKEWSKKWNSRCMFFQKSHSNSPLSAFVSSYSKYVVFGKYIQNKNGNNGCVFAIFDKHYFTNLYFKK